MQYWRDGSDRQKVKVEFALAGGDAGHVSPQQCQAPVTKFPALGRRQLDSGWVRLTFNEVCALNFSG